MIVFEEGEKNGGLLYRRQEVQNDCLRFQFVAWCAVGEDYVVEGWRHVQSKYVKFYNSPRWTLISSVSIWHFFFRFQNAIDRQTDSRTRKLISPRPPTREDQVVPH